MLFFSISQYFFKKKLLGSEHKTFKLAINEIVFKKKNHVKQHVKSTQAREKW